MYASHVVYPNSFKLSLEETPFPVTFNINNIKQVVVYSTMKNNLFYLTDTDELLKTIPVKKSLYTFIKKNLEKNGISDQQDIICPKGAHFCLPDSKLVSIKIDFSKFKGEITFYQHALSEDIIQTSGMKILNVEKQTLSGIINNDFDYTIDKGKIDYYGLNNRALVRFDDSYLESSSYLTNNSFNLYNASLNYEGVDDTLSLSYDNFNSNTLMNFGYQGSSTVIRFENISNRKINSRQASFYPISLFISSPSRVSVIKNGNVISEQFFSVGNHYLDTTQLPSGTYQITLKIYHGRKLVGLKKSMIYKPVTQSDLSNKKNDFIIWAGVAGTNRLNNYQQKKQPFAGISFKKMVFPQLIVSTASILLKRNILSEVGLESHLFNDKLYLFGQLALTTDHSTGFHLSANQQLSSNIFFGIDYTKTGQGSQKNLLDNENHANVSLSLDTEKLGSFAVSLTEDFYQKLSSYSIAYNKTLHQSRTWSLYLNMDYFSSRVHKDQLINNQSSGFSAELNFAYHFNSMDVSQELTFDHSAGSSNYSLENEFRPANNPHGFFNSYGANTGSSSGSDSQSISGFASWKSPYFSGYNSLSYNKSKRGESNFYMDGSLAGSIVFNQHHLMLSNDSSLSSAAIVNMNMQKGDKLQGKLRQGNIFNIHNGANLIDLNAYNTYHFYLQNDENETTDLTFDREKANKFTLLKGSVVSFARTAWHTFIISGFIVNNKGDPLNHIKITNKHGHSVYTEPTGFFVIPVEENNPIIFIHSKTGASGEKLHLISPTDKKISYFWLGNITYNAIDTKLALSKRG